MIEAVDIHTHISALGLPDFEPVWTAATDPLTRSPRGLLLARESFGSERPRNLLRLPIAAPA
jgi:hypothetical protein